MTGKANICLVVIFNYRFDDNIPIIEKIYQDRFSRIYHMVPFYDGNKDNVIPVFEKSFYFQGYIPQAINTFFNDDFSHYLFVGDDVLLNPKINEHNILELLNLDDETAFLPNYWGMLDQLSYKWVNTFPALNAFYLDDKLYHHFINWKKELPALSKAVEKFKPDLLISSHIHEAEGIEDKIGDTRVVQVGKKGKILEI